jgi:hypothetical protein
MDEWGAGLFAPVLSHWRLIFYSKLKAKAEIGGAIFYSPQ